MPLAELTERLLNGEEFVFNFQDNEYWISQNEGLLVFLKSIKVYLI
ncbi:hypothetical protein [Peribacillus frigoritolerans]